MKIALVRARYNAFGGAERFVARAMLALSARDAKLAVLARSWTNDHAETAEASAAGVRFVRCDPPYFGSTWRDVSFARAVKEALRRESFDLVQSHERIAGLPVYRAGDGVHAAWLRRRAAMTGPLARLGMALNPHHRYLVAAERRMFEHPSLRAVICNSEMVKNEITTYFSIAPEKLAVIRNGIDLDRFHPSARETYRATVRARLGIAPETTVFLLVGSGFERKGVARALTALRDCGAPACLVVAGDDKHRPHYEALAARLGVAARVRFVGAVADPLPYFGAADVFVLPTIYDPFPNAALEALACGVPVITTDACGAQELLLAHRNGWVVPVTDAAALARAMHDAIELVSDATAYAVWSCAARLAAEPYSLATLSNALIALYRCLLDTPVSRESA